jgi:hypothetical protein
MRSGLTRNEVARIILVAVLTPGIAGARVQVVATLRTRNSLLSREILVATRV